MKTVMVTGADRGLGLALVEECLIKGYKVIAGKYMEDEFGLNQLRDKYNEQLILIPLDISDSTSVQNAYDYLNEIKDIDLLINNAGILGDIDKTIQDELDFEEMLKIIEVNTIGPMKVIQKMLPKILNSKDKCIINISSEAGSISSSWREGWFGYCMSKSALNMASSIIHTSISKEGGRVLLIHPGHVKSFMLGHFNEEGQLTAKDASQKIMKVVTHELTQAISSSARYLDNEGKVILW